MVDVETVQTLQYCVFNFETFSRLLQNNFDGGGKYFPSAVEYFYDDASNSIFQLTIPTHIDD